MLLFLHAIGAGALDAAVLSIERLSYPSLELRGLRFEFGRDGGARLTIARLQMAGQTWRGLSVHCARASISMEGAACTGGRLAARGVALPFALQADFAGGRAALRIDDGKGGALHAQAGDGGVDVTVDRFDIGVLAPWVPPLAQWQAGGRVSGGLALRQQSGRDSLDLKLALDDGRFASADGLHAAEKLAATLTVQARGRADRWTWSGAVDWRGGAAYWNPFYVEAGPALRAQGRLDGKRLQVEQASLAMEGIAQLGFNADVDLAGPAVRSAALSLAGADLAVLGPRWLTPLLAPEAAERVIWSGMFSGGARIDEGGLAEVDVGAQSAAFALARPAGLGGTQLQLGPVSGHLPWRRGGTTRAEFGIEGGRYERLAFGRFDVAARLDEAGASFERFRVPLLDAGLTVDGLALRHTADGWQVEGALALEPVSLALLTDALALPTMQGALAASVPGLRWRQGEIALDGALVVSVFDGYLQATGLRIREPFGVAAELVADLEVRHLDLGQLTQTFSFGSIAGYVDADVRGLALANWRPVRFDARIGSSPGNYPRRISQRAVQNIGALGGAGAMAALQRGLLSVFDSFGYRELGFRCVFDGKACAMTGLDDDGAGEAFMLVRGGGIPALNVIGYNRRIDWKELIVRLRAAIAENVSPEVR